MAYTTAQGYLASNRKLQHRQVMEDHIGRPLTSNEVVHHRDGDKQNNDLENLRLMTQEEHRLLHVEQDAFNLCGNKDWRKCRFCGCYDDTGAMKAREQKRKGKSSITVYEHPRCAVAYQRAHRAKKRKENN